MKIISTTFLSALFLASSAVSSPAIAAQSEVTGMDSQLSAKVIREKTRQRAQRRKFGRKGSGNQADCGSVDIGNNNNDRSARNRLNPRNTTIVVTGPIINAANCR